MKTNRPTSADYFTAIFTVIFIVAFLAVLIQFSKQTKAEPEHYKIEVGYRYSYIVVNPAWVEYHNNK